jgi:hypothetical protein
MAVHANKPICEVNARESAFIKFRRDKSAFIAAGKFLQCPACASVAQLDRASDFGSEGWGFESLRMHQIGLCRLKRGNLVAHSRIRNGESDKTDAAQDVRVVENNFYDPPLCRGFFWRVSPDAL